MPAKRNKRRYPRTRTLVSRLRRFEAVLAPALWDLLEEYDFDEPKGVPVGARRSLARLRDSTEEVIQVVRLFATGFGQKHSEPPAIGSTNPVDARMRLLVSDPHRGATMGFRIFVTMLFAELELFAVHFSAWWIRSPAALSNFRALASSRAGLKLRLGSIPSDDATARAQFANALKPSAKKGGWLARVGAVFGARVDAPLAEVLHTLTLWRNEFSHPRIAEHAIDWNDPDIAEAMIAVLFAVKLLSFRFAEAAIDRPR